MKELKIVTYLKEHGLDSAIEKFKLKVKEYEYKIHLKYDQLESPMGEQEVQECRGLVLAKTPHFQVLNYAFKKFFNLGEGHAAKVDWRNSKILQKRDGTMISFYFDFFKQEWCVGTTGTAEGEGQTIDLNNDVRLTFKELFYRCLENQVQRSSGVAKQVLNSEGIESYIANSFRAGLCYVFELTSPFNTVVTPYKINELRLLTVRNLLVDSKEYLNEAKDDIMDLISTTIGVPLIGLVNRGYMMSVERVKETLLDMPFTEEGYVVVDDNFNRIKIKNPTYVEAHFLKSKQKRHQIVEVIKQNEMEEFIVAFPEKKSVLEHLKKEYDIFVNNLEAGYKEIISNLNMLDIEDDRIRTKEFAFMVCKDKPKEMSNYYFMQYNGKVKDSKDYANNIVNNKTLYLFLMKNYTGNDTEI